MSWKVGDKIRRKIYYLHDGGWTDDRATHEVVEIVPDSRWRIRIRFMRGGVWWDGACFEDPEQCIETVRAERDRLRLEVATLKDQIAATEIARMERTRRKDRGEFCSAGHCYCGGCV